jgi:hypothetical protein
MIQELIVIAGNSNGDYNGDAQVAEGQGAWLKGSAI